MFRLFYGGRGQAQVWREATWVNVAPWTRPLLHQKRTVLGATLSWPSFCPIPGFSCPLCHQYFCFSLCYSRLQLKGAHDLCFLASYFCLSAKCSLS